MRHKTPFNHPELFVISRLSLKRGRENTSLEILHNCAAPVADRERRRLGLPPSIIVKSLPEMQACRTAATISPRRRHDLGGVYPGRFARLRQAVSHHMESNTM